MQKAQSEKINKIFAILDEFCPKDIRFLPSFDKPWKFLFCVMLSAQSTDKRVCEVAPVLFEKYKELSDFVSARAKDIETIIRPVGLFHAKAKNLIACSEVLIQEHNGLLPKEMNKLVKLPGVGRKTASCIIGDIYSQPAVIVDTHFSRLMLRLGLSKTRDAVRVEKHIKDILSKDKQYRFSMAANYFARNFCSSHSPKCQGCLLSEHCLEFSRRNSQNKKIK